MVAVVFLSPEELELVLSGAIEEPGYRPFPRGRRAEWERQEEERAELENREPEPFPEDVEEVIERRLSAAHWHRYSRDLVLLVAALPSDSGSRPLVALARAQGGRRLSAGTRLVVLGPWYVLPVPIPIDDLIESAAPSSRVTVKRIISGFSRPLPPAAGKALVDALREAFPDLDEVVGRLMEQSQRSRTLREAPELREANATALSFLTRRWRSLRPVPSVPVPRVAATLSRIVAQRSENDAITDDSAVFPGWEAGARPTNGWWTFRHGKQLMWIKNINVSTAEATTGADLVYVRADPRSVVLVQYKLTEATSNGLAIVRPDARFLSQLDRLLSWQSGPPAAGVREDFRLSEDFAFMKFVDPQGDGGLEEDELTSGRYLPARFVREWLDGNPVGPKGGRRLDLTSERSIDPSLFVGLVRSCWIGSRGDVTDILEEVLKSPSRTLTLAVSAADTAG